MQKYSLLPYLLLFFITFFSGCGGGGGGGSSTTSNSISSNTATPSGNNNTVTLSGKAIDAPIIGGDVVIKNINGIEIGKTTTGDSGEFSIVVKEADIKLGFEVIVSNGQMNGDAFQEALKAFYEANADVTNINVTLLTTLIHKLSKNSGRLSLDQKSSALDTLEKIGMVTKSQSHLLNPEGVNLTDLQNFVHPFGVQNWVNALSTDLLDDDIGETLMSGFPNANAGILKANIGDNNRIRLFKGTALVSRIILDTYNESNVSDFSYEVKNAPEGMTISDTGILSYTPNSEVVANETSFSIVVKNTSTGKIRSIPVVINILQPEVVLSGEIGTEGGVLLDIWGDIVLTVPNGAVAGTSTFQVLKSFDEKGKTIYTSTSSLPLEKLLELSLPNPNAEDAPDYSQQQAQAANKTRALPAKGINAKREESNRWSRWLDFNTQSRFIEVKKLGSVNPVNRVRTDRENLPSQATPAHPNIKTITLDAARLYSLCGATQDEFLDNCLNRDPVLFIHGFAARGGTDFNGASHGGGEDTWGNFPELIQQQGYAVFEFTWSTASRFRDTAANLSDAITMIQSITGKKVHLIAHSFGGLLSRTYLQNFAINRPYQDNVQSLLTLGTPHSGIFDEAGTYHNIAFPKGQDSVSFAGCLQASCNQAGEKTSSIWEVPTGSTPSSCLAGILSIDQCTEDLKAAQKIDISAYLGVNKEPGELPALLASNTSNFPVNTEALIGLTIDRKFLGLANRNRNGYANNATGPDLFETGDGLISYAGQRFLPSLENQETSDAEIVQNGTVSVKEIVLGVTQGGISGGAVSVDDAFTTNETRIDFEGYRHTNGNLALGDTGITARGSVGIAYVENSDNLADTGAPHRALTEAILWLRGNSSEAKEAEKLTLNVQVTDASTGLSLSGAAVKMGVSQTSMASAITDQDGFASLALPFYPFASYDAIVVKSGYHTNIYNTGYVSGSKPSESSTEFGRIFVEPDEPAKGSLEGVIVDATTGNGIAGVIVTVRKNGINRTVTTGNDGRYIIPDLIRGTYAVTLSKEEYKPSNVTFNVQPVLNNQGNASLRSILPEGTMSIRLSWDETPQDLDSHLIKYDATGSEQYHIFYASAGDAATGDSLDIDDTSSFGPETVTIQSVDSTANYIYAVHHFSGSGSISSTSNAKVTIDFGSNDTTLLSAPTTGEGLWWKVFEIIEGNIIPCRTDCILDSQPTNQDSLAARKSPNVSEPLWLNRMEQDTNSMPKK